MSEGKKEQSEVRKKEMTGYNVVSFSDKDTEAKTGSIACLRLFS